MRPLSPVWRLLLILVGLVLLALPAAVKRALFRVALKTPSAANIPAEEEVEALRRSLAIAEHENRRLRDSLQEQKDFSGLLPYLGPAAGVAWRAALITGARFGPAGEMYLVRLGGNTAAVSGAGAVKGYAAFGIVTEAAGSAAWLLPLDVPPARVPVLVSRSGAEGLLEASEEGLFLRYVRAVSGSVPVLEEADIVVTSGRAGIFPRGVFVGRVRGGVGVAEDGLHLEAEIDAEFRYVAGDVVMLALPEGSE